MRMPMLCTLLKARLCYDSQSAKPTTHAQFKHSFAQSHILLDGGHDVYIILRCSFLSLMHCTDKAQKDETVSSVVENYLQGIRIVTLTNNNNNKTCRLFQCQRCLSQPDVITIV